MDEEHVVGVFCWTCKGDVEGEIVLEGMESLGKVSWPPRVHVVVALRCPECRGAIRTGSAIVVLE